MIRLDLENTWKCNGTIKMHTCEKYGNLKAKNLIYKVTISLSPKASTEEYIPGTVRTFAYLTNVLRRTLQVNTTRTETPWHSIHAHGWSRPGHQWIQFVGGHCKFHRWSWMVHGWSTTGHQWSFEKFFEQKFVRSAKVRNVR